MVLIRVSGHNPFTKPIVTADYVIYGTGDCVSFRTDDKNGVGYLFVVNRENGELVNKFTADGNVFSSPIEAGDKIIFGSEDGYIYSLSKEILISKPLPETQVEEGRLMLNTISPKATEIDTFFTVFNTGEGTDSVSLTVTGTALTADSALQISPLKFSLPPGGTKSISLTLRPDLLDIGRYSITIKIHSKNNLIKSTLSKPIRFNIEDVNGIGSISENYPESFMLKQNYPNPFNMSTQIDFLLPEAVSLTIFIYDMAGRTVKQLVNGNLNAGGHSIKWDGMDQSGNEVSSGLYYYVLKTKTAVISKRMLLVK
jgi:hypothetical protein